MNKQATSRRIWIPPLYVAQSLPYVVVMSLSVVMYKNLGLNNTDIALYTSWLYLPWVIKPLWAPLIELLGTPRRWIWVMQSIIGRKQEHYKVRKTINDAAQTIGLNRKSGTP